MEEKPKWIKGPLPPLNQSMLLSNCSNDPFFPITAMTNDSQCNTHRVVKSSSSFSKGEKPNSKTTRISPSSSQVRSIGIAVNKNKPPPIESFASFTKPSISWKESPISDFDFGSEKKLSFRECSGHIGEYLQQAIDKFKDDKFNLELIHAYNYTFNELILQEKLVCSQRALLLRNIQQYYNHFIEIFPQIDTSYKSQIEYYIKTIETHQETIDVMNQQMDKKNEKIVSLNTEMESMKSEKETAIKNAQEKDIQISTIRYDIENANGQAFNTQMKLHKKKEKVSFLKSCLGSRDMEIKKLSEQIDTLNTVIQAHQRNEIMFEKYKDQVKLNEISLCKEIQELKDKVDLIYSVKKISIETNTEEIKTKKKLDKKTSNEKFSVKKSLCRIPNVSSSESMKSGSSITEIKQYIETSSQTNDDFVASSIANMNDAKKEEIVVKDMEYIEEEITNCLNESIPDLLQYIISSLSIPPNHLIYNEEKHGVFFKNTFSEIVKNSKSFSWGCRTIHEFLCDPIIRSSLNNEDISIQSVFMDWLETKYKLMHLVKQVAADFSVFLTQYSDIDNFVNLFRNVLNDDYTKSQTIIMSTIFSFAVPLTTPPFLDIISNVDLVPCSIDNVLITKINVFDIVSKSLSKKLAQSFIRNYGGVDKISFIQFLKDVIVFFGEKHKLLFNQLKNLLVLCGSPETSSISFLSFSNVCDFLDYKESKKEAWKIMNPGDTDAKVINFYKLMVFFSEKRCPLMALLDIPQLDHAVKTINSLPSNLCDLYHDFRQRFAIIRGMLEKLSPKLRKDVKPLINDVKTALLRGEIPQILWAYRLVIMKIETGVLDEQGFIPIASRPSIEQLNMLTEYFNSSESIAFAFL